MAEKYVKTKGKKRIDTNIYTKEQITAPEYMGDYGRLVNQGYVIFDFDKEVSTSIISRIVEDLNLKCKKLYTNRGIHIMFRTNLKEVKDRNHFFNWIGIDCDIKGVGINQEGKECYQAIKVNGIERKEEYLNGATSNEELDFAPEWLYHVAKKEDAIDLTIDHEGERNELFFNTLKIRAKKYGFSYEKYVEQAQIINSYVLPKGLPDEELEQAIREEAWDTFVVEEDKKLLLAMAQDVIDTWGCIWANDQIAFYNPEKNRYDTNEVMLKCYLQEKYYKKNITISRIREVLEQMTIQLQSKNEYLRERSEEYVLCDKSLVSVLKDEIIPNTREIYTDIHYPYSIMSEEEFNNFDGRAKSFMEEISCYDKEKNPDMLKIIWESLGCMLAPNTLFSKIFIWYGSGANGKSLLLKIIKKIMGQHITHANVLNINKDFALESIFSGIANVTDDIGNTTLKETGLLKSLIDGSAIEVNRKYQTSISWQPTSQFVICCNEVPKFADTTPGMLRRLAFIPFEMQLKKEEIDIKLESKLTENIDNLRYILTGAIFAYREAVKRGYLTEIPKQKDLINDFLEENQSPIDLFFDYLLEEEGKGELEKLYQFIDGKSTNDIYALYLEYRAPETNVESQKAFSRRFKRKLPSKIELVPKSLMGHTIKFYSLRK